MANRLRLVRHLLHRESSPTSSLYLLVGLGNPGEKHARNRHNIGFRCIDYLAEAHQIDWRKRRFKALVGEGQIGSRRVMVAKPLTFMNCSGKAVGGIARAHGIPSERLLVVHDDLDLPLGRIRLRPGGSSGGHKGIDSIMAELGTRCFARLRVGIGRPNGGDATGYVLSDFDRDQERVVEEICSLVERVVVCFLDEGIQAAMNTYNAARA